MARHETFNAVIAYLGLWLVALFGIFAIISSFELKIIIESISGLGFAIVGIAYFYTDYKKHHPKTSRKERVTPIPSPLKVEAKEETHLQSKRVFWLTVFMMFYQIIFGFLLAIFSWNTFLVNGVEVVTYDDLFALFIGFVSVIATLWTINRIRNRAKFVNPS